MFNFINLPVDVPVGTKITIENKNGDHLEVRAPDHVKLEADDIKITALYGYTELPKIKYYVVPTTIKYKWWFWWFDKTEWMIETEFCTLSGFETKEAAVLAIYQMGERPSYKE